MIKCSIMKIPIRDAQNKQRVRMRPAGRQFDIPGLEVRVCVLSSDKFIRISTFRISYLNRILDCHK